MGTGITPATTSLPSPAPPPPNILRHRHGGGALRGMREEPAEYGGNRLSSLVSITPHTNMLLSFLYPVLHPHPLPLPSLPSPSAALPNFLGCPLAIS
eukprot:753789-Hanusia_phi.AAC.2